MKNIDRTILNLFIKPPFDQNLIVEGKEVLSFSFAFFNNDWDLVLSSMRGRPFRIIGDLDLYESKIESLGNLQSVGGDLDLQHTPLSEEYFEDQIRRMVDVKREIYI